MRRWSVLLVAAGLVASCVGDGATDSTSSPPTTPVPSSSTTVEMTEPTPTTQVTSPTSSASDASEDEVNPAVLREGVSDWFVDAEADPDGRLVVAYVVEDGSVRVLRCRDGDCGSGVDEMEIGYTPDFGELADLDLALLPDGSPVVVAQSWETSSVTVHSCVDPSCSDFSVAKLEDPEPCLFPDGQPCQFSVDFPRIAVGADGLARVAYFYPGSVPALRMATCQDRACSGWKWSTVARHTPEPGTNTGEISFRIDDQGRAVLGYWWDQGWEGTSRSVVVICGGASCDLDPLFVFEIDGGVHPLITEASDDGYYVWYRAGASGFPSGLLTREDHEQGFAAILPIYSDISDVMVAHCDAGGCGEPQYVPPGEDWLLPIRRHLRLFTFDDGTLGAFFHGASLNNPVPQLQYTSCADPECSTGETQALGIGIPIEEMICELDVVITPGMPPRVVYVADGTLHLFTCPSSICTTH